MVRIINLLLTIGVFAAGYFLVRTIQEPIEFNTELNKRDQQVIEKLSYIKELQLAYKGEKGQFAGSFDSLAHFVEYGEMKITKIIGDRDELDEEGNPVPVTYEIITISVKDSLKNAKFALDKLAIVPGVENEKFNIQASKIERGRISVPVYEVGITYAQMLKGLKTKYIEAELERKIGSMIEPNYNGNW